MSEFFLDATNLSGMTEYLNSTGFLCAGESILDAGKAGEGNMNCTLRVSTSQRSFILKQSRAWVEKYPQIPAPPDRTCLEAAFYRATELDQIVASHMPRLFRFDPAARTLIIEDLGGAQDFTFVYQQSGKAFQEDEMKALISYLAALHTRFRDPALASRFQNSPMRKLNHEHIFHFPLRSDNPMDLDAITPGLESAAHQLRRDPAYAETVTALGEVYLGASRDGCLIHGDYFPGSWLRAAGKIYVIDPEFCFFGPPEWDLGVMTAHLYLSGCSEDFVEATTRLYLDSAKLDSVLTRQFAGVEIMRRLIGVAQLPLALGLEGKQSLLERSRSFVLAGGSF